MGMSTEMFPSLLPSDALVMDMMLGIGTGIVIAELTVTFDRIIVVADL
jgi:hypothetical protein